jgi:hypothetical protein
MPPNSKSITESTPGTTQFLNVDLDIFSKNDLQPLVSALGEKVDVLHIGSHKRTYETHLELGSYPSPKSPDRAIRDFCKLIQGLSTETREIWDTAKIRQLNIGIAKGAEPPVHWFAIEAETIKAAAGINARIAITIYPPYPEKEWKK